MMSRRKVFTALGAIGLAPWLAGWSRPSSSSLADLRDMLIPGLYATMGASPIPITADICISQDTGSLLVMAWREGVAPLGFAITKNEIADGTYKHTVGPCMIALRRRVLSGGYA